MPAPDLKVVREIACRFDLGGEIAGVETHGRGLINDTYLVEVAARAAARVILQRINRRAFPQPEAVMRNMAAVLEHAARRRPGADGDLRFPALYRTWNGELFTTDDSGDGWRAMTFIERTRVLGRLESPGQAAEVGRAMGRFHAIMRDLDPETLSDTRPDYHDTPRHLRRLDEAARQAEAGLAASAEVRRWLDFVEARRTEVDAIGQAARAGLIRRQPVHGDTKLDNFLFDEERRRAISLIDLDTVRSGLPHHDVADCLRSCCNVAGESPGQDSAAGYDVEICRAILQGYFGAAETAPGDIDAAHLYAAIRLIPLELGMRFLADYLTGDRYFKTDFAGQNLLRAATQFRLVADIERQRAAIEDAIVAATG
jgi:Ser/Thr protein kinase RdoA (MazF antagonist)